MKLGLNLKNTTIINLDKGIKKSEIAQNNLLNNSNKMDLAIQIKKGK